MARSLKEIRNFNHGIFLNASESDIPDDAASFSLNINPETEDGILGAIKTNKLIFTDIDVSDDDDAAENLNARFGLNERSDVMFAPYSGDALDRWFSGMGTGLFSADRLNSDDIMMYDPLKKGAGPIRDANDNIIRFKTGDDAFVKGDDPNPTADEIIKFLKEKFNIEYDPLKP